jgi:putative ATP-dependent endonuclease of OLD family
MRLAKFEIRNFKGIRFASFDWEDIVVLIGENNAGKSSVLQALEFYLSGSQLKDQAYFCNSLVDADNAMELIGHFRDLSVAEQHSQAVRGRMVSDTWTLKKKFWCEIAEDRTKTWKEQYFSFSAADDFAGWPAPDGAWANFPAEYQDLITQIPARPARPNNQTREQLRELVRRLRPDLVRTGSPDWVANPGGGGNWKSNANSIVPRCIYVKAVHDVNDESTSKEASSYGRIISLIIEKRLMRRPEVVELKRSIEAVLRLFNPDPDHPEFQAQEIRELEARINDRLNRVIRGNVAIRTSEAEIEPMLLPNTRLVLKDRPDGLETAPQHQGHGLQRTLVMTLLQILAEIQTEPSPGDGSDAPEAESPRPVVLAVEEPELYMHPQMERKMCDVLYQLAAQPRFQVICSTHSPVFLDVARSHKAIVRVVKEADGEVAFLQVTEDIFSPADPEIERERVRMISSFNPAVNEVFFARRVVLFEEASAIVAFRRAAELIGLFERYPNLRHDVTLVDCDGKGSIPLFQKCLNHFRISYTVIHDEDRGNSLEEAINARIEVLLQVPGWRNLRHTISPSNLEELIGCSHVKDKPFKAMRRVEEMYADGALPTPFQEALNWIYFGQAEEPGRL